MLLNGVHDQVRRRAREGSQLAVRRAWVQGHVVAVVDNSSFVLDDGSALLEISVANPVHTISAGPYVMVVGGLPETVR
jgi:hypothetical protein